MRRKNNHSGNKRIVTLVAKPDTPLWEVFVELEKTGIDLHAQILQTVLIYHLPLSLSPQNNDSINKAISSIRKLQAQVAIISDRFGLSRSFSSCGPDGNIMRSNNLAFPKKTKDERHIWQTNQELNEDCFDAQLIEVSEEQNQGSDRVNALGWDG